MSYEVSGPLFDGKAMAAARDAGEAIRHKLATEGKALVRAAFAAQIREDHGVFLSTIKSTDSSEVEQWGKYTMPIDVGPETTVVTTELAMYGPWLEGVGSRNFTTRFKGYHGYRMAAQELEIIAPAVMDPIVSYYVGEMNG